jgi:hypothetical protein
MQTPYANQVNQMEKHTEPPPKFFPHQNQEEIILFLLSLYGFRILFCYFAADFSVPV